MNGKQPCKKENVMERFGESFSKWANHWVPSSLVLVFLLTAVVAVTALVVCRVPILFSTETQLSLVDSWVEGFWSLLSFAMQMSLLIITGDVFARAPIMKKIIRKIARIPATPVGAIIVLGIVTFVTRWIHWGVGVMVGVALGREMLAQSRVKGYRLHRPAVAALSPAISCAAVGLATAVPLYVSQPGWIASYVPEEYVDLVPDFVPLTQTTLDPRVMIQCLILGVITIAVICFMMPKRAESIDEIDDEFLDELLNRGEQAEELDRKNMGPAARLENSCVLNFVIGGCGLFWFVKMLATQGFTSLSMNNLNFVIFMLGLVLNKTPRNFMNSVVSSISSVAGVIIQFPLYAGIYGLVRYTGLTDVITEIFMSISTAETFPAITFVYSAFLNFFVPSAGSKFIIEVPYIIPTAVDLGASIPAVLNAYSFGDFATNLIQPFWSLPILAMYKLEFKDIMAYGLVMCIIACIVTIIFSMFIYI